MSNKVTDQQLLHWRELAPLLAMFEAIGRDGAIALFKVDGERTSSDIYTVVVSGGRLGDTPFRRDGSDLAALLRDAIEVYKQTGWS